MLDVLKQQYNWIRSARQVLFAFMEEIPQQSLHQTVPDFGNGTIIGTHIHAANSYRFWLGSFAYKQKPSDYRNIPKDEIEQADVRYVRDRFAEVDGLVQRFLDEFTDRWFETIKHELTWQSEPWIATPLLLLTHVETHEFHHKGQIVSMVRCLGYKPPADDRLGGLFS